MESVNTQTLQEEIKKEDLLELYITRRIHNKNETRIFIADSNNRVPLVVEINNTFQFGPFQEFKHLKGFPIRATMIKFTVPLTKRTKYDKLLRIMEGKKIHSILMKGNNSRTYTNIENNSRKLFKA